MDQLNQKYFLHRILWLSSLLAVYSVGGCLAMQSEVGINLANRLNCSKREKFSEAVILSLSLHQTSWSSVSICDSMNERIHNCATKRTWQVSQAEMHVYQENLFKLVERYYRRLMETRSFPALTTRNNTFDALTSLVKNVSRNHKNVNALIKSRNANIMQNF